MDYTKQAEEMIKMWTETQKRAWDTMLSASRGFSGGQATDMWEKSMHALEESIEKAFETQAEWTKLWAEQLTQANAPAALRDWARQSQDMMKGFADAQARMWSEWFRVVRKLNPSKLSGGWESEVESVMRSWQDTARKALDAQLEWARSWSSGSRAKKPADKAAE
jgi:hypothetical protein